MTSAYMCTGVKDKCILEPHKHAMEGLEDKAPFTLNLGELDWGEWLTSRSDRL